MGVEREYNGDVHWSCSWESTQINHHFFHKACKKIQIFALKNMTPLFC